MATKTTTKTEENVTVTEETVAAESTAEETAVTSGEDTKEEIAVGPAQIMTGPTQKELEDYYNERISCVFPRPADVPYGEHRTVCHNGVNYQIQYDVPVMIPRKVALIVQESLRNQVELDKKMAGRAGDSEFLGEY